MEVMVGSSCFVIVLALLDHKTMTWIKKKTNWLYDNSLYTKIDICIYVIAWSAVLLVIGINSMSNAGSHFQPSEISSITSAINP